MSGLMGSTLTAADVMTTGLRTCSAFSTVVEASLILRAANCGSVPVVEAGTVIGIVTDRDIALAVADQPDLTNVTVSAIMTEDPITIAPEATVSEVLATLTVHAIKRVLVVDRSGQLVGLVAKADLAARGCAELTLAIGLESTAVGANGVGAALGPLSVKVDHPAGDESTSTSSG